MQDFDFAQIPNPLLLIKREVVLLSLGLFHFIDPFPNQMFYANALAGNSL